MGRRHYRGTLKDVVDAHEHALSFGGHLRGQINGALLRSAIGRPYDGHYPRIWSKAAALVESMVGNHPFIDGNKRTAAIVTRVFLTRSGYDFTPQGVAELEVFLLAVAAGSIRFPEI